MSKIQRQSPYQGLVPYDKSDALFFFGREKDTRLIIANLFAAPLTLLYGASGVGKTSVLQAGVVHQLHQRNDLLVVLFSAWQGDAIAGLQAAIAKETSSTIGISVQPTDSVKLADYLISCVTQLNRRLMIILDQFEEYFLYHPQVDTFTSEFSEILTQTNLPISFLIAIREDMLAKLDRFEGRIPNLFGNFLRLDYLDREAACAAIEKPIEQYNRLYIANGQDVKIEPELVKIVLEQVKTSNVALEEAERVVFRDKTIEERIETSYLQRVMTRIWDEEMRASSQILRLETLQQLGGAEKIIRTHLDNAISVLSPSEQEAAGRIFKYLITSTGNKTAHTVSDLLEGTKLQQTELVSVLNKLSDKTTRILRKVPPTDQFSDPLLLSRYEIFHDVLVPAVLNWRRKYIEKEKLAKKQRQLEREQRRRKRIIMGLAFLTLGFFLVLFLYFQTKKAENNTYILRLAYSADANLDIDPELSILLAMSSIDAGHSFEGEKALRKALFASHIKGVVRTNAVFNAAFSPNSKQIAFVSGDTAVHILDSSNKREITILRGHKSKINSATYSLDGKYVVTASDDSTACIWDVANGKKLKVLRGHKNVVNTAAYRPDSRYIVTASDDSTVRIWDASNGREIVTLRGHQSKINSANYSPDGKHIITAGEDSTACIWDVANKKKLKVLHGHTNEVVNSVVYSPDGTRIVTSSDDNTARIWDTMSGHELISLRGHDTDVMSAAYSNDGKLIVTASKDNTARIWDATSGRELTILHGHQGTVNSAIFSPDGKDVLTTSSDKTIRIWSVTSLGELAILRGHTNDVNSAVYSPDGKNIATASGDKKVYLWDAVNYGDPLTILTGHKGWVNSVAFSTDSKCIVTASSDSTGRIWDLVNLRAKFILQGHTNKIRSVAYSPDNNFIVTASNDRTARIWNAKNGNAVLTLRGHTGTVRSAVYSPDGKKIVSASDDGTARICDIINGDTLVVLRGHSAAVRSAAYSPDGKKIVTASYDSTARIWDAANGHQLLVLKGHGNTMRSAVFSPNGKMIVTASTDRTGRIWNASNGKELTVLPGHGDELYSAMFSPDGKQIVTACADGTAHVYLVYIDDLMKLAHTRVTRELTYNERQQYLRD
jgi:WD40 repeat protein